MLYKPFHIVASHEFLKPGDNFVSFKRFALFLKEQLDNSDTLRAKFYRFVLKHFKKHPELLSPIHIDNLKNYEQVLELLEAIILPHLANEKEIAIGLSAPMSGLFFFSTEAFQHLIQYKLNGAEAAESKEEEAAFLHKRNKTRYALVLERFYNFKPFIKEEMIHVLADKTTELTKYYNINIDNRFVEIEYSGALPKIDVSQAQQQLASSATIEELEKILPLSDFTFNGFSIVTATDVTPRYALHKMRSTIIKHNPGDYDVTYKTIVELLKQLCDTQDITFGLLPFLKLNERLVSYYENYQHSIMINICMMLKIPEETFLEWINAYFINPHTVIKKECSNANKKSDEMYKAFAQLGFNGYALVPVYYNNEVAGMLEVSVKNPDLLDENLFLRIDSATPILGQLMHQSQTEFAASITNVIRLNFTSIQPSVLWKFNEVAWNYLKNSDKTAMNKLDEIRFEHVHPLYGAIDIRNSTIERNNALHKDMHHYFFMVKSILNELEVSNNNIVNELKDEVNALLQQTETFFTGNEESVLDSFMDKVNFYFKAADTSKGHNKNLIKNYFKDIDDKTGKAYSNRRILENSMQYLNFVINDYLEKMQDDFQQRYPIYFEKFRTDGVEYDMYLGQSISPEESYKTSYLNDLRFLQLKNMAALTRLVNSSAKTLPVPLQTTQLIYVNASSIDITFRMDEKRFDVEGGYNVRYHIVKKRIDKVHIMDTGERLTQPGKLAIIYTQPQHETDYLKYIHQLQQENILSKNIELLELEELQGVTGLKAIRVEVSLN